RAIPFLMVFLFGFLFSLTVIAETLLSAVRSRFGVLFPEADALIPQINLLFIPFLSFITFLLILKLLPDARTRWRDMAVGALVTTVLFLIGRALLSIFISYSNTGSVYGAAGSIVILLLWIYYSAQIILYGAEFTWLYAMRHGRPIQPRRLSRILELENQIALAKKQSE
nr:YihY/virulence factor BrkB family protein [Promineifilum sp.]